MIENPAKYKILPAEKFFFFSPGESACKQDGFIPYVWLWQSPAGWFGGMIALPGGKENGERKNFL